MNPFNKVLDRTFRGKEVIVQDKEGRWLRGWVSRIHHQNKSIILYSAKGVEDKLGQEEQYPHKSSMYINEVSFMQVVRPNIRIEQMKVWDLTPSLLVESPTLTEEEYDLDKSFLHDVRSDQFVGSFPLVRTTGEIINGHKRIEACRRVGIKSHPVEIIDVTDKQAKELYKIAHRDNEEDNK